MMLVSKTVVDVPNLSPIDKGNSVCKGCARGKMSSIGFAHTSGSTGKTTRVLDLIHSDVMGPMKPVSRGEARFVVTSLMIVSRYVVVFMIKAKSEVLSRFMEYKQLMEVQTGMHIQCLRTDNGGEYVGKAFSSFCVKHGIARQTTVPYTPQQNDLAERMNRTLVEMARAMLYHQHVDKA
ncbi:hypothetical protein ON010_g15662 [Phytophthora cinnamomi]|nr:hypothetical protein ON010_g15662 [Phytophthora cinnamomi]